MVLTNRPRFNMKIHGRTFEYFFRIRFHKTQKTMIKIWFLIIVHSRLFTIFNCYNVCDRNNMLIRCLCAMYYYVRSKCIRASIMSYMARLSWDEENSWRVKDLYIYIYMNACWEFCERQREQFGEKIQPILLRA